MRGGTPRAPPSLPEEDDVVAASAVAAEEEEEEEEGGRGTWRHAAFHVATTIATPAAYAPLPFALASLGWPLGVCSLVGGTLATWYSSLLIASLWEWNGKKHTTYRLLAKSLFEKGSMLPLHSMNNEFSKRARQQGLGKKQAKTNENKSRYEKRNQQEKQKPKRRKKTNERTKTSN